MNALPQTTASATGPADVEALLDLCEQRFQAQDYDGALECVTAALPLAPRNPRTSYCMAMLCEVGGQNEAAAEFLDRTGIAPGIDHDMAAFATYRAHQQAFLATQRRAIALNQPWFLIAALPKSGSSYVCNYTASALRIASGRVSIGMFPNTVVVPSWARQLRAGGAINHEHFSATAKNLTTLTAAGLDRVAVLVRDPRQALLSYAHHGRKDAARGTPAVAIPCSQAFFDATFDETVTRLITHYYPQLIDWIDGWTTAAQNGAPKVLLQTYEEFIADKQMFFERLWRFFGLQFNSADLATNLASIAGDRGAWTGFRNGTPDEWRTVIPAAEQARMWAATPPALAERYGWTK